MWVRVTHTILFSVFQLGKQAKDKQQKRVKTKRYLLAISLLNVNNSYNNIETLLLLIEVSADQIIQGIFCGILR